MFLVGVSYEQQVLTESGLHGFISNSTHGINMIIHD